MKKNFYASNITKKSFLPWAVAEGGLRHGTIGRTFSFRLPKVGTVDPFFGGTRTFWNQRVLATEANGFNPPIKSIVERQPGSTRGIRFVLFSSALIYFEKLAAEQCGKVSSEKTNQGEGPRNGL